MKQRKTALLLLVAVTTFAQTGLAETLARRGKLEFTTEDFGALHYMNAPTKVSTLKGSAREVQSTIVEVLAARSYNLAPELHTKLDVSEQRYYAMQLERAPLNAELNLRERRARAAFNVDDPVIVARAKEIWLTDKTRFMTDETADITQMMFDLSGRTFEDVSTRIKAAQAAIAKGESFEEVVKTYTDDTNYKKTNGKVIGISIARADALMSTVIFKRLKEGEISAPTPTRSGLHIVRLDKKHAPSKKPFEEVRPIIMEQLQEEAAKNARLALIEQLNSAETVVDESAFDTFVGKDDPKLEESRREAYRKLGIPVSAPLPKQ